MTDELSKDKAIIEARPTKDLFISILVRDVTLRDAIGDLLDNAVDGALRLRGDSSYEGLWVKIRFDSKSDVFSISDNCGGIPVAVARDYAFRFGRPEGAVATGHSVGVFGIGMKRALFRLGNHFRVESTAPDSDFTMEVDVEEWKKKGNDSEDLSSWTFKFDTYQEDVVHPVEECGTVITVTSLHDGVRESLGIQNDVNTLVEELQREHLYTIHRGLKITINKTHLEAPELGLLESDELHTAYWESSTGPVHVQIYAGIAAPTKYGVDGGWYVFCNKRLVLGPDQTKVTGWGVKTPIQIPEYHSQFYRFRGYVFFDAEDPRHLPWNTAKTNLEIDSPIYRATFQEMLKLMRTVIDFLNALHREEADIRDARIDDTPLQNAIDNAKFIALHQATSDQVIAAASRPEPRFIHPQPAKPAESPTPDKVWIRYAVSTQEFDLVKEYFEQDKPGDVGRKTFDYFFEREIEG